MTETTLLRCPNCGATNRVPREKVSAGLQAVCGKCKSKLPNPATATPMTVTDSTFASEVERSPLPVLLDAWAPWCGPCRMVAPAIEELATELVGQVRVGKLNVDENPATAGRFDIRSIPTMLVLVGGREVGRIIGAKPKAAIRAELDRALAATRGR